MRTRNLATTSSLADRTVLVTGGAGFLGSHVAQALAARRARVLLQDTAVKRPEIIGPLLRSGRTNFVVCDYAELHTSPALLAQLAAVEYVVHLGLTVPGPGQPAAARDQWQAANEAPWEKLLERLPASVRGVVLASTLDVYGSFAEAPVAESQPACPTSLLANTKLAMEASLARFGEHTGKPVTSLRLATLYGPGEERSTRLIPSCVRNLLIGQPPVIYGDGLDIADYLYVRDAAEGICLALERLGEADGVFNLGSGHGWAARAVAEAVQRLVQVPLPPKHMPAGGPRRCLVADTRLARECLGFAATTRLEAGLAAEIEEQRSGLLASAEAYWFDPRSLLAQPGIFAPGE